MTKEFNSLEEIQKYYVEETNTYVFKENDKYIDLVIFNFDLYVNSTINAWNINALDINTYDINACNINACNIDVWNINAWNINASDINAYDINAGDIRARNIKADDINSVSINAWNISYYAVCFAYNNIKCKSIKGRRKNHKHFVLDGVLKVKDK